MLYEVEFHGWEGRLQVRAADWHRARDWAEVKVVEKTGVAYRAKAITCLDGFKKVERVDK